jgi:hypothetical protein
MTHLIFWNTYYIAHFMRKTTPFSKFILCLSGFFWKSCILIDNPDSSNAPLVFFALWIGKRLNKAAGNLRTVDGQKRAFMSLFSGTARYHHRAEVFRDFVTLSAIALSNAVSKCPDKEDEYMRIINRYTGEDPKRMAQLLSIVVDGLEVGPEDFLGPLFMDLELGSSHWGQFYTPEPVAKLMAQLGMTDLDAELERKPFIRLSEPACGAGGMILPVVELLLRKGHNPAHRLWVQAIDVDRTASLMCYIQLSLWNVPAEVIVGNTLTLEVREVWHTPAYHLFGWKARLAGEGIGQGFSQLKSG